MKKFSFSDVTDSRDELRSIFCDQYCKFKDQIFSEIKDPDDAESALGKRCDRCPMNELVR